MDALTEIVGQADGPVLVAYSFKSDLARIKKALPKAETLDKSVATLDRWNRGEIPVLLAHPASAGHGLNLQNGGHTVVWFGLNWSLELYQQFNARLHRQGQTRPVVIHHIVAEDTVDDEVMEALGKKNTTQSALLNAVKTAAEARQLSLIHI